MSDEQFDRATIEAASELLLDQLSAGKQRRNQLAYRASMPDATEADQQALDDCDEGVRRLEIKLEGLGFAMVRAEEQEAQRLSAEALAERRAAAVAVLSLIKRRDRAVAELDQAYREVMAAEEKIENLTENIKFGVSGYFGNESGGPAQMFLMDISAIGITDINNAIPAVPRAFSPGLGLTRATALRALAKGLPEVEDKAVQDEALADANARMVADRAMRKAA